MTDMKTTAKSKKSSALMPNTTPLRNVANMTANMAKLRPLAPGTAIDKLGSRQGRILTNGKKRNPSPFIKTPSTKSPSAQGPEAGDSKPIGTATVTCSALNVRSDAKADAARIGGVVKGQTLSYYEVKDGWLKISYGSSFGWVNAKFTTYKAEPTPEPEKPTPTPDPQPDPPTPKPETPTVLFKVRVTADIGLNVRTGAGTQYDKIGALEQNAVVEVIAEENGWYKINYNGGTGWISAQYTEKVGNTTPQPPTTTKTVVTSDALNLRDIPGSGTTPAPGSSVYVTIPAGTTLTVLAEQNGWYKVTYGSHTGWCCAAFTAAPPQTSDNALADLNRVITKARSFVRNPHHPYVWGGKGEIMSKQLIDRLNKQYPGKYSKIYANSAEYFNGNYRAFDCSGLCCWCYKNVLGKDISEGYGWQPNSSKAVKVMGKNAPVEQLQIGDVIVSPGHYVMYRGDGKAVESCGSKGLADDRPWNLNGCDAVYRFLQ